MQTAHTLSSEVSDRIKTLLEENKPAIIRSGANLIERQLIRAAMPILIDEIPRLTEWCIELISQRFGSMTINELVSTLEGIRKNASVKLY